MREREEWGGVKGGGEAEKNGDSQTKTQEDRQTE